MSEYLWYPCCPVEPTPYLCEHCTADTTPANVTVTFSDVTDGRFCLCEWMNATFVLPRTASEVFCIWALTGERECAPGYGTFSWNLQAQAMDFGAVRGWEVTLNITTNSGISVIKWRWSTATDAAFDCTASRTATLYYQSDIPHACCTIDGVTDWSGVGCLVNAA